jgi:alpha-mannosidase
LTKQDRFTPRVDQGEHVFRFWLNAGDAGKRLTAVDREALAHNERPFALSYWPSGDDETPHDGPRLSDGAVQVAALKRAEDGRDLIARFFEPTGKPRKTTLTLPAWGIKTAVQLKPFELKTLRINLKTKRIHEVSLLED